MEWRPWNVDPSTSQSLIDNWGAAGERSCQSTGAISTPERTRAQRMQSEPYLVVYQAPGLVDDEELEEHPPSSSQLPAALKLPVWLAPIPDKVSRKLPA
jgi:hypothetical protein